MSTIWYDDQKRCPYSVVLITSRKGHKVWAVWGERERSYVNSGSDRTEMEAWAYNLNAHAGGAALEGDTPR